MAVGQNPVPLVNIKIGGKWMFIHPKLEPLVMPHGQMFQANKILRKSGPWRHRCSRLDL